MTDNIARNIDTIEECRLNYDELTETTDRIARNIATVNEDTTDYDDLLAPLPKITDHRDRIMEPQ